MPDGYFWTKEEGTDDYTIYARKPDDIISAYNDCFVAASVTGAARALLMDAIIHCKRPIYCDTDSIVCEGLGDNTVLSPTELGAWDLEGEGDCIYIYGKKVYALYNEGKPYTDKKGNEKTANKGVKMKATEIKDLVLGHDFIWQNEAPSFKRDGRVLFIERKLSAKN